MGTTSDEATDPVEASTTAVAAEESKAVTEAADESFESLNGGTVELLSTADGNGGTTIVVNDESFHDAAETTETIESGASNEGGGKRKLEEGADVGPEDSAKKAKTELEPSSEVVVGSVQAPPAEEPAAIGETLMQAEEINGTTTAEPVAVSTEQQPAAVVPSLEPTAHAADGNAAAEVTLDAQKPVGEVPVIKADEAPAVVPKAEDIEGAPAVDSAEAGGDAAAVPASTADSNEAKEGEPAPVPASKEGTSFFNDQDVLSGRGGGTNVHPGNRNFRDLINLHRRAYLKARKNDKPAISRAIVRSIRENKGRFLKKDEKSGLWYEIGDDAAREKTSQALRQRAPEMRKLLFDTEREEARAAAQEHLRHSRMMIGIPPEMMNGAMPPGTAPGTGPQPPPMNMHPGANPMFPNPALFAMAGKNGMPPPPGSAANMPPGSAPGPGGAPTDPYMMFNAALMAGAAGTFIPPPGAPAPTGAAPGTVAPSPNEAPQGEGTAGEQDDLQQQQQEQQPGQLQSTSADPATAASSAPPEPMEPSMPAAGTVMDEVIESTNTVSI